MRLSGIRVLSALKGEECGLISRTAPSNRAEKELRQKISRNSSSRSSKAWGNKTNEMFYSSLSLKMISFCFILPSLAAMYEF